MEKFKKSFFLLSLFIITVISSFGQRQRDDSLAKVIKEIAYNNVYEVSYTVGIAGAISQQLQRFDMLLSLSTNDQLLNLATHNKSAVVRLYAFQALKRKKIEIPSTIIQQFQNDNTIVATLNGCVVDKKRVSTLAQQNIKSFADFSN